MCIRDRCGGNSLKAVEVIAEINHLFQGLELEIKDLFLNSTIKKISLKVEDELKKFMIVEDVYKRQDDIEPNAEQIIQNEKDGHQTFIYKLLLARTGINPKKNAAIGELAKNIEIAIEQEKKINEDIHQCKGQITCNIGRIIDEIRKDDGKVI